MGLKDLMVRIRADNSELDKAVIESSKKLEQVGKRLDRMGRSLSLNVTAPILALGTGAVASSIKFEDAMAGVAKTVDASAETITALGDEFKALSEQIPVAATELANIGEAAGQLGIETSNILGFTRVIADLGVATNLTSEEAATDLARLANITGMPQNAFDRLGSTVVALGNNLATTEREIVAMGLRLAGAGTQVGLTEDQILALAGSLSSVGIEAESGGTALSKVMAEMAIAVGDGGDKLEQFARIAGMSGAEFAEVFETDAADAIVTFVEGLGRLKDEGVNVFQVLESVEFGNIRVRDALLRASGAGELMRESLDLGSTAWRENTALAIEAAKFNATTGNQLKIVWNQIRNMAAELGDNLTPALLATVDAAKPVLEVVGNMINWFGELPKSIQTAAIGMVALTAALGPLLVVIGNLTIAVGVLLGAAALGGLSSLLLPGGAILAGLVAVTSLFLGLKKSIDGTAASQRSFTAATGNLTEAEMIAARTEAIEQEAEARRKLADAEREHDRIGSGGSGRSRSQRIAEIRELYNEVRQAADDAQRLDDALNKLQSSSGGATGGDATVSTDAQTLLDKQAALLAKQAALAKQLQDEMVAMTKTAVDDMQLEYDRRAAHIIDVNGAISEDWQTVLDGMRDKISRVGLAEGFGEEIDALRTIVEGLDDEFSVLTVTAAASLEALRRDILETEGGAEDFKKELEQIDALLKGLPDVDVDLSFFGELEERARSILDPTAIASAALGGLLSGGISTAISGLTSALGGLFGPSEEQIANTEAIKKNIEAANRLADNLNALSDATVTLPFDALANAIQFNAQLQAVAIQRIQEGTGSIRKKQADIRSVERTFFPAALQKFGLTLDEVTEIADALRIDFQDLRRDGEALSIALANLNTFNRDFGLLQKQFALLDINDPAEKFASVMDLLASQVSDEFGAVLSELTPENFDAFLEMFRAGFADFDRDLLGDNLTFEQFLTAIGFAESALDGLATEVERATSAIRSAPAGFKVEAARFRAADPSDRISEPVRLRPADPVGRGRDGTDFGDFTRPGTVIIEGDLIVQGVEDTRDLLEKLENQVEWRARTGTSVLASTMRTTRRL